MKPFVFIIACVALLPSCRTGKAVGDLPFSTQMTAPSFVPGPKAIVYKTRHDYRDRVPVLMNEARTEILSYPAPADVYYRGRLAYPTPLVDGYLLDNRGIGASVAFLDYTYEAYSRLEKTPSRAELMQHLLDTHPLLEAWNCGLRTDYQDEVAELNARIAEGFRGCRSLLGDSLVKLRTAPKQTGD